FPTLASNVSRHISLQETSSHYGIGDERQNSTVTSQVLLFFSSCFFSFLFPSGFVMFPCVCRENIFMVAPLRESRQSKINKNIFLTKKRRRKKGTKEMVIRVGFEPTPSFPDQDIVLR